MIKVKKSKKINKPVEEKPMVKPVEEVKTPQPDPITSLDPKVREELCIAEIANVLSKYNMRLEASLTITEYKVTPIITVVPNTSLRG